MSAPRVPLSAVIEDVWRLELTPVQTAICRVSDGLPLGDLWERRDVRDTFGGTLPPEERPDQMVVCAAIRTGKTIFVAAMAIMSALYCDLSPLAPGENARVPVLATTRKQARAAFDFIVEAARRLGVLAKDPSSEELWVVHPETGQLVEITVTAGSRGGASLVARWLAGVVFDEFTLMVGEEDGVINLDSALRQTEKRMLPGAQVGLVGSPHAPFGPGHAIVTEGYGAPTVQRVVAWGTGPDMNPRNYPPAEVEKLRRTKPAIYRITCERAFLDPEAAFFDPSAVDACSTLEGPVEPENGHHYVAAMDPATRGNAWTLVVLDSPEFGKWRMVLARQWMPRGTPLSPDAVFEEMADLLEPYGVRDVLTDGWAFDALNDNASNHGLTLMVSTYDAQQAFPRLQALLTEGRVELQRDAYIRRDLIGVKKRPTLKGVNYVLPRTKGDGRHGDYVPALLHALEERPDPPAQMVVSAMDPDEAAAVARIDGKEDEGWLSRVRNEMTRR